jgi:hypothetical protein
MSLEDLLSKTRELGITVRYGQLPNQNWSVQLSVEGMGDFVECVNLEEYLENALKRIIGYRVVDFARSKLQDKRDFEMLRKFIKTNNLELGEDFSQENTKDDAIKRLDEALQFLPDNTLLDIRVRIMGIMGSEGFMPLETDSSAN